MGKDTKQKKVNGEAEIVYLKGKGEPDSIAVSRRKKLTKLAEKASKEKGRKVYKSEWLRDQIDKAQL